ncbi:uncharacterized protein LOC128547710 [Mercenaria mercenaria]|uniref:uncharacterized protein LOC128547710 n=1 Tax=Mercenaria mercenaria TaxID=6596 RepID=UPI00234E84F4|nr:uncharacterized protein LOC128547710 [Mercenaria mercenaria]
MADKVASYPTHNPKCETCFIVSRLRRPRQNCTDINVGFGKTLCFVINAMVLDSVSITLVISPLLSLMDSQMEGISRGEYSFVFASPESVLKPKWRTVFMNDVWQKRLTCIVFDEAHCISEWGEDFRPDYKDMAQLRSFFKVPVLALTATSTVEVKNDIMSVLQLSESDTDVIARSANRQNIFIECQKRKKPEYEEELRWLIHYLKEHGKNSKKIIIYCRSIDTVSEIFITFKEALGLHAYIDKIQKSSNLIVEMYHKCTHDSSKRRIINEFSKSTSSIRCLVATVALGMGLDIKDIDMIIHIGCPKSVISYWQEAGRCARDGRQGLSLILYDNFTASLKSTNKDMSEIVKSSEIKCLRQMIINHFTVSGKEDISHHVCSGCKSSPCKCDSCRCCSFCSRKCPCTEKDVMFAGIFLYQQDKSNDIGVGKSSISLQGE